MRLGCCLNTIAKGNDITGIKNIEHIVSAGFDYVELPLAQMMELSNEQFDAIKHKVEIAGIPCETCNNFFPRTLRLTGEQVDQNAVRRYVEAATGRARSLGVKIIVFGSPGSKNVPEGFPYEIAMEQILEALHLIDGYAGDGLRVVIEPVCRRESNIILTVPEGFALYKECGGKNIALLVDYYHMSVEGENLDVLQDAAGAIEHVHLANPNGRIYPAHGDGVDYMAFIDTLKSIGYNARISVEAFTDRIDVCAKEALDTLRSAGA